MGDMVCSQCGNKVKEEIRFCPKCGTPVPENKKIICPVCGATASGNSKFCPQCGENLNAVLAAPVKMEAPNVKSHPAACDIDIRKSTAVSDVGFSVPVMSFDSGIAKSEDYIARDLQKQEVAKPKFTKKVNGERVAIFAGIAVVLFLAGFLGTKLVRPFLTDKVDIPKETVEPSDFTQSPALSDDENTQAIADSEKYINSVKNSKCPYFDATYTELFEGYFTSLRWSAYLNDDNEIIVYFSGEYPTTTVDKGISMEFVLNKDASQNSLNKLIINETEQDSILYPEDYKDLWADMYDRLNKKDMYDGDSDYILPYSNSEYLTESDLYGLTERELKIARNEIYARHGRQFLDEDLQAYFNSKSWYNGAIAADDFDKNYSSVFNKFEQKNSALISEYENSLK